MVTEWLFYLFWFVSVCVCEVGFARTRDTIERNSEFLCHIFWQGENHGNDVRTKLILMVLARALAVFRVLFLTRKKYLKFIVSMPQFPRFGC